MSLSKPAAAPSSPLRTGWLSKKHSFDEFVLALAGGIDELHKIDLRRFLVDISLADGMPCAYIFIILIIDRAAYIVWLTATITELKKGGEELNKTIIRRFERLFKVHDVV